MEDIIKVAVCDGEKSSKQIASKTKREKKLVISYAGEEKAIPLGDIYYMESRNHNIVLYLRGAKTAGAKKLEYYGRIKDLEDALAGQFYRIHRGYLVNLFHVAEYGRTEVRMANGDKLLLSRYRYEGFVQAYEAYASGKANESADS